MGAKQMILNFSFIFVTGMFLGLLVRVMREKINPSYWLVGVFLAFKLLVLYPFFAFPILIYRYKIQVVNLIADEVIEHIGKGHCRRKDVIKIEVLKYLSFKNIIKIWLKLLKSVSKNYDSFIDSNMDEVAKIISGRERSKNIAAKKTKARSFKRLFEGYLSNNDEVSVVIFKEGGLERFC